MIRQHNVSTIASMTCTTETLAPAPAIPALVPEGAICTGAGRKLYNRLGFTVSRPDGWTGRADSALLSRQQKSPHMSLSQKSEVALDIPSSVRLKRRQLRRC